MNKQKIVIIILAAALITLSGFASILIDNYLKDKSIIKVVKNTENIFAEKVFNINMEVYGVLNKLPEPPDCDAEIFEKIIYKYKHVKNIGVMKGNRITCDVYTGTRSIKDYDNYKTFKNDQDEVYKFWKRDEYATVVAPNGYFVEYDENYYVDFDVKNEISGLFIYGRQSREIWFSRIKHNLTGEELNQAKTLLQEEFEKLNKSNANTIVVKHIKDYIIGLRISDLGSITGVIVDTKYVQSFNKIGLINLAGGVIIGFFTSLMLIRFYYKRKSLKSLLVKAIENEDFKMVYQPLVTLTDNQYKIIAFEALVRWQLDNGDNIRPDIFIPIAENDGLSHKLTCLLIKNIFTELHHLLKENKELYVSINISPDDLYDLSLVNLIKKYIQHYKLSADNVVVELTERVIADKKTQIGLDGIIDSGIKISIDDFGTGASNVKYLADLNPDVIKIDKAFVEWSDSDGPAATLLEKLIAIGKEFNLKIVVEGVETAAQAERCRTLGADIGQGYYWYKPMGIKEIKKLFKIKKRRI